MFKQTKMENVVRYVSIFLLITITTNLIPPPRSQVLAAGSALFIESSQLVGLADSAGGAIGDLNGDGHLDIVIPNYETPDGSGGVPNEVWFGSADGSFVNSGQALGSDRTSTIALDDFNNDGFLDIFEGNWNTPNRVWFNNGNGFFVDSGQSLGGNALTQVVLAADMDGDGDIDLFEGLWDEPSRVWFNNGNGFFISGPQNIGDNQIFGAALADFDGDGDVDLYLSRYFNQPPDYIFWNDGSGNFTDSGQRLGNYDGDDVAAADFDNDGDIDVVVMNRSGQPNIVWLNDGTGNFSPGQAFGTSDSRGVAVGDLDDDGDLDLFIANENGQPDEVWLNNGNATFVDSGAALGNFSSRWVGLADFNGDDTLDAFVASWEPNRVYFNQPQHLLAIYMLALDNDIDSPANLTPYYSETVRHLIEATQAQPDVTVIILADLHDNGDTHILRIQNGQVHFVAGLPDNNGNLVTYIQEYDMTDGPTLGGFLIWARANHPASRTVISLVGHGTALVPDVVINDLFPATNVPNPPATRGIIPLPSYVGADPAFSDVHPHRSLLKPHALRVALSMATNNGANPIDVLDLIHCFAATIEELYELSNPSYAEVLVGSANYAYFAPDMLANGLTELIDGQTAAEMGLAIQSTYEARLHIGDWVDGLPDVNHPRSTIVVRTDNLGDVKINMDQLSWHLALALQANASETVSKLLTAYQTAAAYYDTTYCQPHDWELATPDALVDITVFMQKLAEQFGPSSDIGLQSMQVINAVQAAIIQEISHSGIPWFAAPETPFWNLGAAARSGLALFADFQGRTEGTTRYLTWQARYYTSEVSIDEPDDNPSPFQFVQGGYEDITWADVFYQYWSYRVQTEGIQLKTEACLPELKQILMPGELSALYLLYPLDKLVRVGQPVRPTVVIQTSEVAMNPLVTFNIRTIQGQLVFSNTVGAGYLQPGEHAISSSKAWIVPERGRYTIEAIVDSDNRIIETNEADNRVTRSYTAHVGIPLEFSAHLHTTWSASSVINVTVTNANPPRPDAVQVQIFEYLPNIHPDLQVPRLTHEWQITRPNLPEFSFTLPPTVKPGAVIIHLWAIKGNGLSKEPAVLLFNYAPASTLQLAESRYFIFPAAAGNELHLTLNVISGAAALSIWEPGNPWQPQILQGSGTLGISPTRAGNYVMKIENIFSPGVTQYYLGLSSGN